MRVTRRGVLIGALAGGGLAAAYMLREGTYPLPLAPGRDEVAYNAWIKIAGDGVISVAVPQTEMGQGITTLIPQVIATELGADWRQIAVEPAPVSASYANLPLAAHWAPLWMPVLPSLADDPQSWPDSLIVERWAKSRRFMATADGTSLAAYEAPARAAAATVRALLAMAAARRWNVPWEDCTAENGFVVHGDKRLSFATLVEEAAALDPPNSPPLRPLPPRENPAEGSLRFPRLDLPSKVDGGFLFAGDVRLPEMVYASIRHGPIGPATLSRYEAKGAKGTRGLLALVRHERWLAAVASNWWAAEQALARIKPQFRGAGLADTLEIEEDLDRAVRFGQGKRLHEAGEPDEVLGSDFSIVRRYDVAPALHGTNETATATARLADGRLELWVATQAPEAAREAAAIAVGLDTRDVVLYPMPAGGSFDRRLEHDHAVEAAVIAREIGRPVQLVWSRWQEHLAGRPRTPVAAVLGARTSSAGRVVGWRARLALPPTAREFGRRLFGRQRSWDAIANSEGEADSLAMEGAIPPYSVAHMSIEHIPVRIALATGRLRGNAHSYTAFFNESFIDELARDAGREPLSFRMAMLEGDLRLAECLQRVAALANWGGGADNSGQGLACHVIGDGRIAAVARTHREDAGLRVERISAVVDIGRIVNLDIARQQIEGGLVFGLGLALGSSTNYAEGLPTSGRLAQLNLPLLANCPEIEVDFIESEAEPADPGELGVAVTPPAIANALFSATGIRFRRLPLLSEGL